MAGALGGHGWAPGRLGHVMALLPAGRAVDGKLSLFAVKARGSNHSCAKAGGCGGLGVSTGLCLTCARGHGTASASVWAMTPTPDKFFLGGGGGG